jgi:hypothetical protein
VTSITALLTALANNNLDEIVVANGIYHVSTAGSQRVDSLWIGSKFASRTRPITVRAETTGGVVFDGGGATYFGGLWFNGGAHDQTWQGFVFANGTPTQTGVIVFGEGGTAPTHHITLKNITIRNSVTSASTGAGDHAVYISSNSPHDIVIDGLNVDGTGGVDTALHFYHDTNAYNVTVRNMTVKGTAQAIMLWASTTKNVVIEDSVITGATKFAVSYERGSNVTFRRVTSTGSGQAGFYSSLGSSPSAVTFIDTSLR